jgi:hypothetical protein
VVSLTQEQAGRSGDVSACVLPDALWRQEAVRKLMGKAASLVLRAGRLRLAGQVPNRQRFIVNPMRIWPIQSSTARMGDQDLGEVGPLPVQTRLADF